ncbi:MAG: TetR/AcrR family transcriptional regulator [Alphaproteobacteria bacterium]|nr:MAG: TetR/AcrR family transcriptional regulator [Alphaproteobacteria bacterium]
MAESKTSSKSDPKADIIAATEQVLTSGGVSAATVRVITGLAGVNSAAINYHFGSRDELFGVVCSRRMQPANRKIIQSLEALEDQDTPALVTDIFRPLVETALQVWVNDDVLRALRAAIFFSPRTADSMNEQSMADVYVHMRGALMRACPHLATRDIRKRFRLAMSTIMHVVAAEDAHLTWAREDIDVDDLVAYVSAGFKE